MRPLGSRYTDIRIVEVGGLIYSEFYMVSYFGGGKEGTTPNHGSDIIHALNASNLPSDGPIVLMTNLKTLESQVDPTKWKDPRASMAHHILIRDPRRLTKQSVYIDTDFDPTRQDGLADGPIRVSDYFTAEEIEQYEWRPQRAATGGATEIEAEIAQAEEIDAEAEARQQARFEEIRQRLRRRTR